MIKINRADCPNILLNAPRRKSHYSDASVTSQLDIMQFEKCAYCEKKIQNGSQVDHYIPIDDFFTNLVNGKKQYDWDNANQWSNLLHSCSKCNRAKTNHSPFIGSQRVIIDPTISDPERFIDFKVLYSGTPDMKVFIIPKNGSPLGKNTITKLKLDIRVKDHLAKLVILALEYEHEFLSLLIRIRDGIHESNEECQRIINKINTSMFSNRAYAGFIRSFFRKRIEDFENNERTNIEANLGRAVNLGIIIPTGVKINH